MYCPGIHKIPVPRILVRVTRIVDSIVIQRVEPCIAMSSSNLTRSKIEEWLQQRFAGQVFMNDTRVNAIVNVLSALELLSGNSKKVLK